MLETLRDSSIISPEQFIKIEEYITKFQTGGNGKNSQKRVVGSDSVDPTKISREKRVKSDGFVRNCCLKRMMCRHNDQ